MVKKSQTSKSRNPLSDSGSASSDHDDGDEQSRSKGLTFSKIAAAAGLLALGHKIYKASKKRKGDVLQQQNGLNGQNGVNAFSRGDEGEIIANVEKLSHFSVDDVMIPRADLVGLSVDMSLDDVASFIDGRCDIRYAVYGADTDDILGFVHVRDILHAVLQARSGDGGDFSLRKLLRSVLFVAPSMRVLDLLLRMRVEGVPMAMVVDEYGGIDGQINLEYLMEEIVGDIRDERAGVEPRLVSSLDGSYVVDGRYGLDDLQDCVGNFLDEWEDDEQNIDNIDTVGGLITALAGHVPVPGEVVRHVPSGWEFQVLQADPRRIHRLRLYRKGGVDRGSVDASRGAE